MRARVIMAVVVLAFVLGCGESSDKSKETTDQGGDEVLVKTQRPYETPSYIPKSSTSLNPLGQSVLDTMRHYKRLNNVTRDEAWPGRGGVLANDYLEVWYPEGQTTVTHGITVLNIMMQARKRLQAYLGRAPEERLVVLLSPFLETYKQWTGNEYWQYSEIHADTLTLQPLYVLLRRGLSDIAIPHEYYQWAMGYATQFAAPRWLEEGVASYLSSEGPILKNQIMEFPVEARMMPLDEIEAALMSEKDRQATRVAYYHAYEMVKNIADQYGDDKLVQMINLMGQGATLDQACVDAFGLDYQQLVSNIAVPEEKVQ